LLSPSDGNPAPHFHRFDLQCRNWTFEIFISCSATTARRVTLPIACESGRADDRFTIDIENVNSVWLSVFPIFAPGDLVSTYIAERLSPTMWGYYSLWGVRQDGAGRNQEGSYVDRALAIYRHVVGVLFDRGC
jgi:hypothetical protein